MGKQCLYDHSVRVPLIFRGPGIDAGRRVDSLVYLHDLFSTLCGRAGVPVPDSVMGRDVLNDSQPREELYLAYTNCQRALLVLEDDTDGRQGGRLDPGGKFRNNLF